MRHTVLTHSSFFEHMDDFGYLRDLEDLLPDEFTAVFEIARVLENESSEIFRRLSRVMTVTPLLKEPDRTETYEWQPNRIVSHGEEQQTALMRNFGDMGRILPHQYLLPDEVFMRRLAQRSLWINIPSTPVIIPFGSSSNDYTPDNFKQKVYLLLDTSTSMGSHHRMQMARAVVYVFLKRNLRELGHVYFRTFDTDLGPLQTANDAAGLRRLIQYMMRLRRLGNGTVMERAIIQATEDIKGASELSGAEILIVTDGACHLDCERIRSALGDTIRINTVKIGSAELKADDKLLREIAARSSSSATSRSLAALDEEVRRAKFDLGHAATDSERSHIQAHLRATQSRSESLLSAVVDRLRSTYGREIEELSNIFVNVDDISTDAIFALRSSEIAELRELLADIESDFSEGIDADALREAALLYEHVQMLLANGAGDNQQIEALRNMSQRLEAMLKGVMQTTEEFGARLQNMSRSDVNDLSMMLNMKGSGGGSFFKAILAMVRRARRTLFGSPPLKSPPDPPTEPTSGGSIFD